MATSPNYAWAEPDNSSLVKNGAADIRTLGDAIDTSVWNVGYGQAGKNKLINGDMTVWQRGTSITLADNGYGADRYIYQANTGTMGTGTLSRQTFTPATAPVAGYEGVYFNRYNLTATGTSTSHYMAQRIENVQTFAGQTATFSFWGKADSARTITSDIQQNFGSGGSGAVITSGTTHSFTTSWTRFTVTFSVPSISGKTIGTSSYLAPRLYWTTAAGVTIDTWGWQLEYGSKATPFQTATGTIQGELAACQRYYQKSYSATVNPGTVTDAGRQNFSSGVNNSGWNAFTTNLRVSMRTLPTVTLYDVAGTSGKITTLSSTTAETNGVTGGANYISNQSFGLFLALSSQAGVAYHYVAEAEL